MSDSNNNNGISVGKSVGYNSTSSSTAKKPFYTGGYRTQGYGNNYNNNNNNWKGGGALGSTVVRPYAQRGQLNQLKATEGLDVNSLVEFKDIEVMEMRYPKPGNPDVSKSRVIFKGSDGTVFLGSVPQLPKRYTYVTLSFSAQRVKNGDWQIANHTVKQNNKPLTIGLLIELLRESPQKDNNNNNKPASSSTTTTPTAAPTTTEQVVTDMFQEGKEHARVSDEVKAALLEIISERDASEVLVNPQLLQQVSVLSDEFELKTEGLMNHWMFYSVICNHPYFASSSVFAILMEWVGHLVPFHTPDEFGLLRRNLAMDTAKCFFHGTLPIHFPPMQFNDLERVETVLGRKLPDVQRQAIESYWKMRKWQEFENPPRTMIPVSTALTLGVTQESIHWMVTQGVMTRFNTPDPDTGLFMMDMLEDTRRHFAEEKVFASITRLMSNTHVPESILMLSKLLIEQRPIGMSLEQVIAVNKILASPFLLLTGGPGVGKTFTMTIAAHLLAVFGGEITLEGTLSGKSKSNLIDAYKNLLPKLNSLTAEFMKSQPGLRNPDDINTPHNQTLLSRSRSGLKSSGGDEINEDSDMETDSDMDNEGGDGHDSNSDNSESDDEGTKRNIRIKTEGSSSKPPSSSSSLPTLGLKIKPKPAVDPTKVREATLAETMTPSRAYVTKTTTTTTITKDDDEFIQAWLKPMRDSNCFCPPKEKLEEICDPKVIQWALAWNSPLTSTALVGALRQKLGSSMDKMIEATEAHYRHTRGYMPLKAGGKVTNIFDPPVMETWFRDEVQRVTGINFAAGHKGQTDIATLRPKLKVANVAEILYAHRMERERRVPSVYKSVTCLFLDEQMLSIADMAELLEALPNLRRLYLVGDIHQLGAMEPGALFPSLVHMLEQAGLFNPNPTLGDLFSCKILARLITNHRIKRITSKGKSISVNPSKLINGRTKSGKKVELCDLAAALEDVLAMRLPRASQDVSYRTVPTYRSDILDVENPSEQQQTTFKNYVLAEAYEVFKEDPNVNFMVPYKEDPYIANRYIFERGFPHYAQMHETEIPLFVGMKIKVTKNTDCFRTQVFANGDMGTISHIIVKGRYKPGYKNAKKTPQGPPCELELRNYILKTDWKSAYVIMDGRIMDLSAFGPENIVPGWFSTAHSRQGSQGKHECFVLLKHPSSMTNFTENRMAYTVMSRAEERFTFVGGSVDSLERMIKTQPKGTAITRLISLLNFKNDILQGRPLIYEWLMHRLRLFGLPQDETQSLSHLPAPYQVVPEVGEDHPSSPSSSSSESEDNGTTIVNKTPALSLAELKKRPHAITIVPSSSSSSSTSAHKKLKTSSASASFSHFLSSDDEEDGDNHAPPAKRPKISSSLPSFAPQPSPGLPFIRKIIPLKTKPVNDALPVVVDATVTTTTNIQATTPKPKPKSQLGGGGGGLLASLKANPVKLIKSVEKVTTEEDYNGGPRWS